MCPNKFANFIQAHSIFLLNELDVIPITPIKSDAMLAQCHPKTKERVRNPIEIIRMVDFDVSVFMLFSLWFKIGYK